MSAAASRAKVRNLVLVLGDQLDRDSRAFDGFDAGRDAVWMAEAAHETEHVLSHKLRIAFFFAAMRHFRDELRGRGKTVHYTQMPWRPSEDRGRTFGEILGKDITQHRPDKLIVVRPGAWRVLNELRGLAVERGLELEVREDGHFYTTPEDFAAYAKGRKTYVLEGFYREVRRREDVLVTEKGKPLGGEWNFDAQNRETFDKEGPPEHKAPRAFTPDALTREVIELVAHRFAGHPGSLGYFNLPVTRQDALAHLREFISERLPLFGKYQDALWTGGHFLFHSRLSALLNVKLLNPREVVDKAVAAYHEGEAPINSVEGLVRQVLGWREFIRGIYWHEMPEYAEMNHLEAAEDVPPFFWDGGTDMACIHDAMTNVVNHGYAHHIQRLMVLGLFAQLYGVDPRRFNAWHEAMYLDAVDWVSLPNALGMSQYGDGGIVGTKPYCASANYINKMSNYCKGCRYNPKETTGEDACPFNAFYWDFLARHHERFKGNRRMTFQVKNLERKDAAELERIRRRATRLRKAFNENN